MLFVYDINISIYSMVARIFEIECVFFFRNRICVCFFFTLRKLSTHIKIHILTKKKCLF